MTKTRVSDEFRRGDRVVLVAGTYQGTPGVFLQLRPDAKWAEITEPDGTVHRHPIAWMAHSATGKN